MVAPASDYYGCASGQAIAGGRQYVSPFWRNLSPGWTDLTPSGARPPFGILGFSGSAWDEKGGKLYINGGGHADYGGNEVWEWDYENRATAFVRHYQPDFSSIYGVGTPEEQYEALAPYVDNVNYPGAVMSGGLPVRPISRHTYASLVWMPHLGKFTVGGGSTFSGTTPVNYWDNVWPNAPLDFWYYDPIAKTFEYRGSKLLDPDYMVLSGFSLHESRQKLYGAGGTISNQVVIHEYDPALNTWTKHANLGPSLNVTGSRMVIDTLRDRLVVVMKPSAAAYCVTWEYNLSTEAWTEITTMGTAPADFNNEAWAIYAAGSDALWMMRSAAEGLMKLDLTTNEWTTEAISWLDHSQTSGNWYYDARRGVGLFCYQNLSSGIRVWAYKDLT